MIAEPCLIEVALPCPAFLRPPMRFVLFAFIAASVLARLSADDRLDDRLDDRFRQTVRPYLKAHCIECHNGDHSEGDLNLDGDTNAAVVASHFRRWMMVKDRLEIGDMPPADSGSIPDAKQSKAVIDWIADLRSIEAQRRRGDPGIVLARRLSNAEYNNTVRDLTGQDLKPASSFPVDPANQEGFDNSGESLSMSPALLNKYLDAARFVSEHLVLTPTGIEFSPHPAITDTDRDKYCVNRIMDFYRRQKLDYQDFLFALWQYEHRTEFGISADAGLEQVARSFGLSSRYMRRLSDLLRSDQSGDVQHADVQHADVQHADVQHADVQHSVQNEPQNEIGPIAALRRLWQQLPDDASADSRRDAKNQCARISEFIHSLRTQLVPEVDNLRTPEVHQGSQPLVLWKNRQFVANRRRYVSGAFEVKDLGLERDSPAESAMKIPSDAAARSRYEQSFEMFCSVFPDTFVVTERARVYLDPKDEKKLTGRYLSAGFHSQMGYFRDDQPLYDLILDDEERLEIDRLWLELDYVTSAPMRQYAGFIWFDRTDSRFMRDSEFDGYRAEDKDCISQEKVRGLAEAYLSKAEKLGGNPEAIEAIRYYFDDMSRTFRYLEKLRIDSQPVQLDALLEFAERAFRRPLADEQRQSIVAYYHRLRTEDHLSHEDAMRDCLVSLLLSPHFCYRLEFTTESIDPSPSQAIVPLDDYALANRLSYFLWSSMPDQTLMETAAAGRLRQPEVLVQQVRRMTRDERIEGLANEFAGNWLGFRRFEEHNGVDRGRFPQFTDQLRRSMYQEPIRFISRIIREDRSVLDLLYSDEVIVDSQLATHYGIATDQIEVRDDGWGIVRNAHRYGRGGLMPMAVFLTASSPGLRTSPVKRGNWLVKQILGEQIPAPPAAVAELPDDESDLGELTLRQALERHRADATCASCHDRIDSFGLVFEQYGPIGEWRTKDLGGRPIDATAEFTDGSLREGMAGLRDYIRGQREADFIENFCRKLLAYGLGRSLQLSDEIAIDEMTVALSDPSRPFSLALEMIVTSPAFLNKRVIPTIE